MTLKTKYVFASVLSFILLVNIVVVFDIPVYRQILSFFFLTFLPGALLLCYFKLDCLHLLEKAVISTGLSISFLMLLPLIINQTFLALGNQNPLLIDYLLIAFDFTLIVLLITNFRKKGKIIHLDTPNFSSTEKLFLVMALLFPIISVMGTYIMNNYRLNYTLIFLYVLIALYVILASFNNENITEKAYPLIIYFISLSIILVLALRSNHLIGVDIHHEYYLFQLTNDSHHWKLFEKNVLDACISISILPTVYFQFTAIDAELLYKILFSLICSISPLAIYVLTKRYIGAFYGFLTSIFFIFQYSFVSTASNPRTNISILFFSLVLMVLFNDRISLISKRALAIIFISSSVISHYSTSYIFFFIIFLAFLLNTMLIKLPPRNITFTFLILFFIFIFFWYSQITVIPFDSGVHFFSKVIGNLNNIFIDEVRSGEVHALLGRNIFSKNIPSQIEYFFTWFMLICTGIGVLLTMLNYKQMLSINNTTRKSQFLHNRIEVDYLLFALICIWLLLATLILPFLSKDYSMLRIFALTNLILSLFFIIGSFFISHGCNLILRKYVSVRIKPYYVVLIIIIPYYLCVSGLFQQYYGVPGSIVLTSSGTDYENFYVHDTEKHGALWLKENRNKEVRTFADKLSVIRLLSLAGIKASYIINEPRLIKDGYLYYRQASISGEIDMSKNIIYTTGGIKIWR